MEIIRRSQFRATHWKNGGGITHEAIRVPAGGAKFRWRVSVARIDASGPFSDFSGYHRAMLLLTGGGISLAFSDGSRTYLRKVGDIVEFDGALSADCELLDGPCEDLNLMVSQALEPAQLSVERVSGLRTLEASTRGTSLIVALQGGVCVAEGTGAQQRLEPGDLVIIPPRSPQATHVDAVDAPARAEPPLMLLAILDDVP